MEKPINLFMKNNYSLTSGIFTAITVPTINILINLIKRLQGITRKNTSAEPRAVGD